MIETIVALISRMPPAVVELVVDIVKGVAGSKSKGEAARRAIIIATKRAFRA